MPFLAFSEAFGWVLIMLLFGKPQDGDEFSREKVLSGIIETISMRPPRESLNIALDNCGLWYCMLGIKCPFSS